MELVPRVEDIFIYDDSECIQYSRKKFWSLNEGLEILEFQKEETRDSFVHRITFKLLASKNGSIKFIANSCEGVIFCKQVNNNKWFIVLFNNFKDLDVNPKTSALAITIYPKKKGIDYYLFFTIFTSLFDSDLDSGHKETESS